MCLCCAAIGVIKSRAVKELPERGRDSERSLGEGNFLLPYSQGRGPLRNK